VGLLRCVMKRNERLKKEAEDIMSKIRAIIRHIRNVQDNCLILGEKLILRGEFDLGRNLIAHSMSHDLSKFSGIEWKNMAPGVKTNEEGAKLKLKLAVHQHNETNHHHAEAWGGIKNMPRIFLAECVADWKARSEEFGESLKTYIDTNATKRYNFTNSDKIYKDIMEFVELLCEKPFENIVQS